MHNQSKLSEWMNEWLNPVGKLCGQCSDVYGGAVSAVAYRCAAVHGHVTVLLTKLSLVPWRQSCLKHAQKFGRNVGRNSRSMGNVCWLTSANTRLVNWSAAGDERRKMQRGQRTGFSKLNTEPYEIADIVLGMLMVPIITYRFFQLSGSVSQSSVATSRNDENKNNGGHELLTVK